MAEVTEHRAVRLVEHRPHLLAVRILCLGEVDRDDAVSVPDRHRFRHAREQVEGDAAGVVGAVENRDAELVELRDEVAFGAFGGSVVRDPLEVGVVGTCAGQAAAEAQPAGIRREPGAAR